MSAQAPGHIHHNRSVSGYCVAREKAALTQPSSRRGKKNTFSTNEGKKWEEKTVESNCCFIYIHLCFQETTMYSHIFDRINLTLDALGDQFINRAMFNSYCP